MQRFVMAVLILAVGGVVLMQWPRADQPRRRWSANEQAVNFVNEGTDWLDSRTAGGAARAESLFKSAIDSDSSFADAYAGLAQTYNSYAIGNYSDNKPEKYFIEARKLAQRALALDSTVAEAHSAMANVSMFYDFDWAAAERSFKQSLALDARSANSRAFRLALYEFIGQFREAVAEGREDVWLQPRSEQPKLELARALFFDRQYGAAAEQLARIIERDTTRFRPHLLLGEVLAQQGRYDSAVIEMQAAVRFADTSSRTRSYLANVYARAGRTTDAQRELQSMYERARHRFVPAFDFAIAYAGVGNMDSTFAWLNKSVEDHTLRPYLMDPTFDSIRSDSRYKPLLGRIHLPYPAAR